MDDVCQCFRAAVSFEEAAEYVFRRNAREITAFDRECKARISARGIKSGRNRAACDLRFRIRKHAFEREFNVLACLDPFLRDASVRILVNDVPGRSLCVACARRECDLNVVRPDAVKDVFRLSRRLCRYRDVLWFLCRDERGMDRTVRQFFNDRLNGKSDRAQLLRVDEIRRESGERITDRRYENVIINLSCDSGAAKRHLSASHQLLDCEPVAAVHLKTVCVRRERDRIHGRHLLTHFMQVELFVPHGAVGADDLHRQDAAVKPVVRRRDDRESRLRLKRISMCQVRVGHVLSETVLQNPSDLTDLRVRIIPARIDGKLLLAVKVERFGDRRFQRVERIENARFVRRDGRSLDERVRLRLVDRVQDHFGPAV